MPEVGDSVKIRVMLQNHPSNYGSESPWGSVVEVVSDDEMIVMVDNYCVLAPFSYEDRVRVKLNVDEDWQVVEAVERAPHTWTWAVYLTNFEEVEGGNVPDEMEQRSRAVIFDHELREAAWEEFGEDVKGMALPEDQKNSQWFLDTVPAICIAPIVVVALRHSDELDNAEAVTRFEDVLLRIATKLKLMPESWTSPYDIEDGEPVFDEVDFEALTESRLTQTDSAYDPFQDSHWTTSLAHLDVDARQHVLDVISRHVKYDQRVATDLENGRYDRVELLLDRLFTDPADLVPLDGPIWKD